MVCITVVMTLGYQLTIKEMLDRLGFRESEQTFKYYFYDMHTELQNLFRYRAPQRPFIKIFFIIQYFDHLFT